LAEGDQNEEGKEYLPKAPSLVAEEVRGKSPKSKNWEKRKTRTLGTKEDLNDIIFQK